MQNQTHESNNEQNHKHGQMRRDIVRWLALGAAAGTTGSILAACGGSDTDSSTSNTTNTSTSNNNGTQTGTTTNTNTTTTNGNTTTTTQTCSVQPTETNGPYPADGTRASGQTLNALELAGFMRSDIRTSVGSASGTATGTPLKLKLKVVNVNNSCAALEGYGVYIWSCTDSGEYSLYTGSALNENYLRGLQVSDSNGELEFTTIFPACYSGRWPHIHFEVYQSALVAQTSPYGDWNLVSQIALPEDICRTVYQQSNYSESTRNLNNITLASDMVFGDGYSTQMATITGDVTNGYTAELTIGLAI